MVLDIEIGNIIEDYCDVLIGVNGLLNLWKYFEEVEGFYFFKGKLFYIVRWLDNYGEE